MSASSREWRFKRKRLNVPKRKSLGPAELIYKVEAMNAVPLLQSDCKVFLSNRSSKQLLRCSRERKTVVLCIETRKPRLLRAASKTQLLPNRSVSKNLPTIASHRVGNAHSLPHFVRLRDTKCVSPIELTSFWSRWEGRGHFPNIAAKKWWVRSVRQAVIVDHALDIACWSFQPQQTRCATNCRAAYN